jgi:CheY-like chemotaxis protein
VHLAALVLESTVFLNNHLFGAMSSMVTVLIVEDDPINVRVFSKILTKLGGLEVRHTEDVETVINMARSGEIHIILMDICLTHSNCDGIKITQMLKADPKTVQVPIILVTALGDRENLLKQSGADDYISKPIVDPRQFINQVFSVLT